MKLVTWRAFPAGRELAGVLLRGDRELLDLAAADLAPNPAGSTSLGSVQAIIEGGPSALERVAELKLAAEAGALGFAVHRLAEVRLLAPLPRPPRLRCFSVYEQHMKQSVEAVVQHRAGAVARHAMRMLGISGVPAGFYRRPTYYKGNHLGVVGHDADVVYPSGATQLDYELEMAMVIGKGGRNIQASDAAEHIFGYCCFNDFSARDLLFRDILSGIGPQKGKDFDGSNALGPWLVTKDEIRDPYDLRMEVRVNGKVVGHSHTGTMYHPISAMIEWASFNETLVPGEVFATGAAGNGCGIERWEFIGVGDVVEIEVEGLGVLRNRIVHGDHAAVPC